MVLEVVPRALARTFTLREAADLLRGMAADAPVEGDDFAARARALVQEMAVVRERRESWRDDDIRDPIGQPLDVQQEVGDRRRRGAAPGARAPGGPGPGTALTALGPRARYVVRPRVLGRRGSGVRRPNGQEVKCGGRLWPRATAAPREPPGPCRPIGHRPAGTGGAPPWRRPWLPWTKRVAARPASPGRSRRAGVLPSRKTLPRRIATGTERSSQTRMRTCHHDMGSPPRRGRRRSAAGSVHYPLPPQYYALGSAATVRPRRIFRARSAQWIDRRLRIRGRASPGGAEVGV